MIRAVTECDVIKISIAMLRQVLPTMSQDKLEFFNSRQIEKIAEDVSNLEALNNIALERFTVESFFTVKHHSLGDQLALPIQKRKYNKGVPELEREEIQDCLLSIQQLWSHLSRGANTVPKGTVDLVKEFLGESGLQCYQTVFLPMEEPTAPCFFNAETFWFCWISFLANAVAHDLAPDEEEEEEEDEDVKRASATSGKGVLTITIKNASQLLPMDTTTGKADPYVKITVDGMVQKTASKSATLEPVFSETMQFNCFANESKCIIEVMDAEAMGSDRSMGSHIFVIRATPVPQHSQALSGQVSDGRQAQGVIIFSCTFTRGGRLAKNVDQMSEFQLFCQTENYREMINFYLNSSRRIERTFFKVPLAAHEREFSKAVGALTVPLTGLAIKQYLTYLLVEHSHAVDVYACREFCSFFKRKLDDDTSIMYRDIVKLIKERNSGMNNHDIVVGSALNPHHWSLRGFIFLARLVSLYHVCMVPVRIGFQSEFYTLTSPVPLSTDLPADLFIVIYIALALNMAYKNSKSQWITNRFRSGLPPCFEPIPSHFVSIFVTGYRLVENPFHSI